MPGYLARLRQLSRSERLGRVEEALHARLISMDDQPLVASQLACMHCDGFRITHLTYSEPDFADDHAVLQFTYHLRDGSEGHGLLSHDEIRGSGIAQIDDDGAVHLSEVDAERVNQSGETSHEGDDG